MATEKNQDRSPRRIPSVEPPAHYTDGRGTSHTLMAGDLWVNVRTDEVLATWVMDQYMSEGTWELTEAGNKHMLALSGLT